jgi:hypothetical protein
MFLMRDVGAHDMHVCYRFPGFRVGRDNLNTPEEVTTVTRVGICGFIFNVGL